MTPNGMIAHLYGPVEGRRHDAGMLRLSGLLPILEQRMHDAQGMPFALYGDPAYPLREHLMCPYRGAVLTNDQRRFNHAMSQVRQCVEWGFGDVRTNFAFVDYKKNQRLLLQPVGKYYKVAVLLTNCRACLYGNQTSEYFGLQTPVLQNYINNV